MKNRLETLIDTGSAAIFGASACWCTAMLLPAAGAIAPVAVGGAGVISVLALMKKVGTKDGHRVPAFELAPLPDMPEAEELVLAHDAAIADELMLDETVGDEELLLEAQAPNSVAEAHARLASAFDALAPLAQDDEGDDDAADAALDLVDPLPPADDRVVALFGGERASAHPGELKARIDAHLAAQGGAGDGAAMPPDASDALARALGRLPGPRS